MKKIRLIELFAGVGSQASALERIGADFESYKISEWEINAVKSYNAIHSKDRKDYSEGMEESKLDDALIKYGISADGKELLSEDKIKRKPLKEKKEIYNTFRQTKNLGSIVNIKGEDLEIVKPESFTYLLTYSFPCQDLSIAGKRKGMSKGENTRSGLLWEVERLLNETENLPQVLLMENVPQVHGSKNMKDFEEWMEFLEEKGYTNYWQDLNSRFFGVAQNRNRTFMVSLLGGLNYEFPRGFELKKKMVDYLEENVDEKYYVNNEKAQKVIDRLIVSGDLKTEKSNNEIQLVGNMEDEYDITNQYARVYNPNGIMATLGASGGFSIAKYILSTDEKDIISTIEKYGNSKGCYKPFDKAVCYPLHSQDFIRTWFQEIAPTLSARDYKDPKCVIDENVAISTDGRKIECANTILNGYHRTNMTGFNKDNGEISPSLTVSGELHRIEKAAINYRIRKLTPRECWRLMGFNDEEFSKAEKVCSNSQLYKQAGNSIVVDVLCYIFKNIIDAIENPEKIKGQTTIFDFFN